MNRFATRARKGAGRLADTDLRELRARVQGLVDETMDQVERLVQDAPSAAEAKAAAGNKVEQVRDSHAVETIAGLAATAAPLVAGFARRQLNRRNASRAARVVPHALRAHPVLFGAALAGSALVGVQLLRRRHAEDGDGRRRGLLRRTDAHRATIATGFDLDEEVARMEGEGGEPGAFDGAPPALVGGRNGTR